MKITGTFLDEISHDIPHQNWGYCEWDRDFAAMKSVGIEEVFLIRSGYKKWMTYPSKILADKRNCFIPPVDLVELFLELSDKWGMKFYFGTYDSGEYWHNGEYQKETDLAKKVCDEVWAEYGHHKSFAGWYVTNEVSKKIAGITDIFVDMGKHLKDISGGLPIIISPYIHGKKDISSAVSNITSEVSYTIEDHYREWEEIMSEISGYIDIIAFQDGHVEFDELYDFLCANKELADKYGLECRTNSETFDRDMPIKFLPIKWEKLLLKLKAAERAGYEKAITFEFSHFMSPNSMYPSAGNLYNRYREYLIENNLLINF